MRRLPALLALAAAAAIAAPTEAGAIPAFARKYRFSCSTCHDVAPHLKPYGEEYAGRGFALEPGQEPARAAIDAGDPLLSLPRDFPLALRFDAYAEATDGDPETDLQAPWVLKVLSGGRIAEGVGYYAYVIVEDGELKGPEDAYLQFTRPFGLPVNLLVGQFQISDPLAKRELRLTRLDYAILTTRVGDSVVNLTYDRGLALAAAAGPVDAMLMVTNGTGIGAGVPFDRDPYKNVALHLAADAGPVRLGAFGAWGRARPDGGGGARNTTWYLGPQVGVALGERALLSAVYLERRDSNPLFAAAGADVETRGGFLEAVGFPLGPDGRWAVTALYNKVDSDLAASRAESAALSASFLYRRNVRLTAEVDRDLEGDAWRGSVGTVAAF